MTSKKKRKVVTLTPTMKKRWVKALRSGKYPQTTGQLCRTSTGSGGQPVGYCCLGVLKAVCPSVRAKDFAYLANTLPFKVQAELAELNDNDVPFEVIAGVIDVML